MEIPVVVRDEPGIVRSEKIVGIVTPEAEREIRFRVGRVNALRILITQKLLILRFVDLVALVAALGIVAPMGLGVLHAGIDDPPMTLDTDLLERACKQRGSSYPVRMMALEASAFRYRGMNRSGFHILPESMAILAELSRRHPQLVRPSGGMWIVAFNTFGPAIGMVPIPLAIIMAIEADLVARRHGEFVGTALFVADVTALGGRLVHVALFEQFVMASCGNAVTPLGPAGRWRGLGLLCKNLPRRTCGEENPRQNQSAEKNRKAVSSPVSGNPHRHAPHRDTEVCTILLPKRCG